LFCGNDNHLLTLLGVFLLKRGKSTHESFSRSYDTLGVRIAGGTAFQVDRTTTYLHKWDVIYLPKNLTYSQKTTGETVIAIHFINHDPKVQRTLEVFHFDDFEELNRTVTQMHQIWEEKKPGYKTLCTSLLYKLLYEMCRTQQQETGAGTATGKLSRSVDHIHTYYKDGHLSIRHLAELSSVSETYFRRLFKELYGVSPNQYITNLKMEYAAQMLQSKLYTVTQVSDEVGYTSVKYFERVFKQHYGTTPTEYMRQNPENTMY
jgi:AraC-like DNA-binding protein